MQQSRVGLYRWRASSITWARQNFASMPGTCWTILAVQITRTCSPCMNWDNCHAWKWVRASLFSSFCHSVVGRRTKDGHGFIRHLLRIFQSNSCDQSIRSEAFHCLILPFSYQADSDSRPSWYSPAELRGEFCPGSNRESSGNCVYCSVVIAGASVTAAPEPIQAQFLWR